MSSNPTPPKRVKCPDCGGHGDVWTTWSGSRPVTCGHCHGTGEVPAPPAERMTAERASFLADSRYVPAERVRLHAFTCGCHAVLHRDECPVEERIEIEVVPLSNPADDAELVERVARALYERSRHEREVRERFHLLDGAELPEWCSYKWTDLSEWTQTKWRDEARKVVQTEQADHGIEP